MNITSTTHYNKSDLNEAAYESTKSLGQARIATQNGEINAGKKQRPVSAYVTANNQSQFLHRASNPKFGHPRHRSSLKMSETPHGYCSTVGDALNMLDETKSKSLTSINALKSREHIIKNLQQQNLNMSSSYANNVPLGLAVGQSAHGQHGRIRQPNNLPRRTDIVVDHRVDSGGYRSAQALSSKNISFAGTQTPLRNYPQAKQETSKSPLSNHQSLSVAENR